MVTAREREGELRVTEKSDKGGTATRLLRGSKGRFAQEYGRNKGGGGGEEGRRGVCSKVERKRLGAKKGHGNWFLSILGGGEKGHTEKSILFGR